MFVKLMFTTMSGAAYDSVAAPRALTTIGRFGIVTKIGHSLFPCCTLRRELSREAEFDDVKTYIILRMFVKFCLCLELHDMLSTMLELASS